MVDEGEKEIEGEIKIRAVVTLVKGG